MFQFLITKLGFFLLNFGLMLGIAIVLDNFYVKIKRLIDSKYNYIYKKLTKKQHLVFLTIIFLLPFAIIALEMLVSHTLQEPIIFIIRAFAIFTAPFATNLGMTIILLMLLARSRRCGFLNFYQIWILFSIFNGLKLIFNFGTYYI